MLRDLLKRVETQGSCVLCGPAALEGGAPELDCRDCGAKHFVYLPCVKKWGLGGTENGEQFGELVLVVVLTTCPDTVLIARELGDTKPTADNEELKDGLMGGLRAAVAEKSRERESGA
ncbi:MAG TPA: hypothetical protein VMZ50_01395 [Phycisphaerae bacterium]|nr:hypothetical protein [Phycisphaerae bacterium]